MRKYSVESDLVQVGTIQPIVYKQYDNGDQLEVELYQDGDKIELTTEKVLAFFELTDGTVVQKNCTIANGNAIATLDNYILSQSGTLKVEFTVTDAGTQTTTRTIKINVETSINRNGGIINSPSWDLVQEVLDITTSDGTTFEEKVNELKSAVEEKYNELSAAQQLDSEVILARNDSVNGKIHASLKERLDESAAQLAHKANEVELKTHTTATSITNGHLYKRKPVISITFDDAPIEDFLLLKPLMDSHGVKGTIYVNSNFVGKTINGQPYMTLEQIKQLVLEGWEMGSHTASHSFLDTVSLSSSPKQGDTILKIVNSSNRPFYNSAFGQVKCIVYEKANEDINEVVYIKNNNVSNGIDTATLLSPITKDFTSAGIRLHPDEIEKEVLGSKNLLTENGVPCNTFAYPWGSGEIRAKEIVAKHFAVGRDALGGNAGDNGGFVDGNEVPLETYELKASELANLTTAEIDTLISKCIANKTWLILLGHTYAWTTMNSNLEYLIQKAKSLNVDIMTMSEALKYHNNLIDLGVGVNRFSVAHEGSTFGGVSVLPVNKFNSGQNISNFPFGISMMRATSGFGGFPTPNGTLITYRSKVSGVGQWTFQYWHDTASNSIYYRNTITAATFTEWSLLITAKKYVQADIGTKTIPANSFATYAIPDVVVTNSSVLTFTPYGNNYLNKISFTHNIAGAVLYVTIFNHSTQDVTDRYRFNVAVLN